MAPVITLTTDFGWRDGYVAAMKGAILSVHPAALIVDVSHDVPPQDVGRGAFLLGAACPYFPPDTVHVAVVDPGVGTDRRLALLATPRGLYLAPDNGLLTYVLAAFDGEGDGTETPRAGIPRGCSAYALDRREFWRGQVSDTFHGRDILAPVAAHLSAGVAPEEVGSPLARLRRLDAPQPRGVDGRLEGRVIYVDGYGNLVTNIRPDAAAREAGFEVTIAGRSVRGPSRSYAEAEGLLTIVGSNGYLEVALTNGSAAKRLNAGVGAKVVLRRAAGDADG